MANYYTYPSPIGLLRFENTDDYIASIQFVDHEENTQDFHAGLKNKIIIQLDDYFNGKLFKFDLPLNPSGTDFQKKVWTQLELIEYGQQISYGDLAMQLGNKNLVRAVGGANSKNPLAIIVPCHRVIGSNNRLVGYAGGLWRKKWLLRHELEYRPNNMQLF